MLDFGFEGSECMYLPHEVKRPLEITEFFSAFEHKCRNNYSFAGEMHNFWEILILMDGELRIMQDDKVYRLSKNQIIFHNPKVFHSLQAENNSCPNYFVASFNVVGDFMERFGSKVINLSEEQMKDVYNIVNMLHREGLDNTVLKVTKFLKIMGDKPVLFQKFTSCIELFLIGLSESNMLEPKLINNEETMLYKKAVNTLEDYIYSNITVEELARQCSVSTAHLKRIFSKYAGIGIHEYFLQLKILHAKKLLSNGMGVTEVAEKMSFSSQNYFSVVFKRKVGVSPLQYKKNRK